MENQEDIIVDNEEMKLDITTDITITEYEQKIFDTLLEVKELNNLNTVIRVNGGWVRDKMLKRDCKDIDFALDDTFGADFAEMLSKHLYPGQKHKYGVIKANSEKSKHLETATIKVHDMFIDLVNLRCEEYADDSRVPQIRIGTPLEDALRRDLTINSLFYNINEKKIEDFTGKGIDDLKNGIIRTPLEPLQTFLDDPLRILRTIRFATRFNFDIVDEITESIKNPKIKTALAAKVSYERIGKETDLMMEGENPAASVKLFYDFKIFSHILKFHDSCKELQNEEFVEDLTYGSFKICEVLGILFKNINKTGDLFSIEWPSKDELKEIQKYTFYSGILAPFREYDYTVKKGQKAKTEKMINYVMFESLKQPNKGKTFAATCLGNLDKLIDLTNDEFDIFTIGSILRELGEFFKPTLLLALSAEYYKDHLFNKENQIDEDQLNEYVLKYERFYLKIKRDKLENAHLLKPLLNGKDIMGMYSITGGPLLKKLSDKVFKWQIEHPEGTLEEIKEFMLLNKDEFILL